MKICLFVLSMLEALRVASVAKSWQEHAPKPYITRNPYPLPSPLALGAPKVRSSHMLSSSYPPAARGSSE